MLGGRGHFIQGKSLVQPPKLSLESADQDVVVQRFDKQHHHRKEQEQGWGITNPHETRKAIEDPGPDPKPYGGPGNQKPENPVPQVQQIPTKENHEDGTEAHPQKKGGKMKAHHEGLGRKGQRAAG
jgi:hypothetical protein